MEKNPANENDPLTFSKIGLQAALILNRLRVTTQLRDLEFAEQEQEQKEQNRPGSSGEEKQSADDKAKIEHRLRELSEWENRLRDDALRRRKI